jgi:hypothetical protein
VSGRLHSKQTVLSSDIRGGTMVLIDKDDGSFRRTILYTHFDLSDAGTCKMTP